VVVLAALRQPGRKAIENARRAAGVFFVLLAAGCASLAPQTAKLHDTLAPALHERVELTEVPFFPQSEYQCGPAALATVLAVAQKDFDAAVHYYQRAIDRVPLPEFVIALGEVYEHLGKAAEAKAQSDIIWAHTMKTTGGKTYTELAQTDPLRATYLQSVTLRTALMESYLAFKVADLVMGIGLIVALLGASQVVLGGFLGLMSRANDRRERAIMATPAPGTI
jgi:tetratricopeptide (TPR) repeat protein